MNFSEQDKGIMKFALNEAKEAGRQGNFPIGGALAINNNLIDVGRNQLRSNNDWYSHAENKLIEKYSGLIRDESKKGSKIELYSTLEPCFMCFGTSLLHRIPRIIFGCPDPYGGIASLDKNNFPIFYSKRWPEVKGGLFAKESYDLLLFFFKSKNTSEFKEMFNIYKTLNIK